MLGAAGLERPQLLGRRRESALLARLLDGVRAQRSGVLVLRGDAGIGKTALIEDALEHADGLAVVAVGGVESEMELPFAGLHRLCRPLLGLLDRLPAPQRDALAAAFGLHGRTAPDRFLVGLAVLSLLSEAAAEQPLVCVVDDAQWLDRATAQALAFAARRLSADAVAMLFAVRGERAELAGLPEYKLGGLSERHARALLASVISGRLDERVSDRIVAETGGNPLALLELPRGFSRAELAAGFGVPSSTPLAGRIEESFLRRLRPLPEESRMLLLVAAAEPLGDPRLLWLAAAALGISSRASEPLEASGLIELGARVRFRHPLVRSAVYSAASDELRREVHRALAAVTDAARDPDRRAWHRAQAASEPDESVAAELERSAERARDRGGAAAAGAFLAQASALTPDPARRAARALAAARAEHQSGNPESAVHLLATAEAGPLADLARARADRLRAEIAFTRNRGSDAPPLLLRAARRLVPFDPAAARETYLEAIEAAIYAGRSDGATFLLAAELAPPAAPPPARVADLLLDGYVALRADGLAAATPLLKVALRRLREAPEVRWLGLGCRIAAELWDGETWHALAAHQRRIALEVGALSLLPQALNFGSVAECLHSGDLAAATSLISELQAIAPSTGIPSLAYGPVALAAWRGREAAAIAIVDAAVSEAGTRGEGQMITFTEYAAAVLHNGLGNHDVALVAAHRAVEAGELIMSAQALAELVEAALGVGERAAAEPAARELSDRARMSGTDWALGMDARSRALLAPDEEAEALHRKGLDHLARDGAALHLARARIAYGNWLIRQGRRREAREQLREAHAVCETNGAEAFAARAEHALAAAGESMRRRAPSSSGDLTEQEERIARLAREGRSNADIGAELFISPRTVEYHLGKVFAKLGIESRRQLEQALVDP